MITIYIKEWEEETILNGKIPKWIESIMFKIIKGANIIVTKTIDENKKVYFIPDSKKERVYKKIRKKLEKEATQTQKVQVVLSKEIKKYQEYFKKYKIVDGKTVFEQSIEKILNEILGDNMLAMQDIYVLTNQYCEKSVSFIKRISSKVKSVNIITKEIEKYRILEEILANEGMMICVANNKKKSLKRAKIIINLDLKEEELKKYTINRSSMIINLNSEKIKNLNAFEGMIIQDIEFKLEEKEVKFLKENNLEKRFKKLEIYESLKDKIDLQKLKISELYGNNGKIDEKELRNMQKILTNEKN